MKIILVDQSQAMVDAWKLTVGDAADVVQGDIFSTPTDAVVSPANSFGFMDGGIDLAYSRRFGWNVQASVQERIRDRFDGELLVGQALSVPTGDADFPLLIAAPTMRVNMMIIDPQAVRLATRAAVREALKQGLSSMTIPGMGTGCGRVKPDWAARLMAKGIEDAINLRPFPRALAEAWQDHHAPYTGAA
jgi:O-acetyl-ADP-ribose deacetylase (regulator of RNase III)